MTVDVDKLLRMAEQITDNMNYTDDTEIVVGKVTDHLQRFWDPRMKAAIVDHYRDEGSELSPGLRAAVAQLKLD